VNPDWPLLRRAARETARALLDLVLPPACPACGAAEASLCQRCRHGLERRPVDGCVRCGEPARSDGRCGGEHRELRHVAALVAPFRFAGTGGALVRAFKLDGNAAAGTLLVRAMADAFRDRRPDLARRVVLVPVPLHRARRRRRGFDQAAWLARGVGRRLSLPVCGDVLVRRRLALPQGDPRVLSRTDNVRGVFAVRRPERVAGRSRWAARSAR
jgi:predicted amidophosphoribosyltransferase